MRGNKLGKKKMEKKAIKYEQYQSISDKDDHLNCYFWQGMFA